MSVHPIRANVLAAGPAGPDPHGWLSAPQVAAVPLPTWVLPPPRLSGGLSLMQALLQRRSCRGFASAALPEQVLADLLWAAGGINRPGLGGRTTPRAIELQDIEIYVALPAGLYRYEPAGHLLRGVASRDLRAVTGNQDFIGDAALDLVFVADHRRVAWVQAEQREAYAYVAAGAMAQSVYLACASLGLATVLRAWIDRDSLGAAMTLDDGQQVLLAQTVGYPKAGG
jgi:nitroreductase